MTLAPPALVRPRFLQTLSNNNPFYLLSAMCMLFGIFAVNDSLNWSPIPQHNLLTMILTLNIYEALLIGLAVVLLQRSIRRDAIMLLLIEAFFLVDVGFLNMEVFAASLRAGLVVNTLVLAAAIVKVMFILRAARAPLNDGRFAFVAAQLAILFAIPGVFAAIARPRDTYLPQLAAYAGWWVAGLLPVAYAVIVARLHLFHCPADGKPVGIDLIVSRVLLILPLLSIIAHLSLSHWVYKCDFHPANLAPLMLGLAVAVGRCDEHIATLSWRMRLHLMLPLVAIMLSAFEVPRSMIFDLHGAAISPLRLAFFGAMLVYLDGLWLHRHILFACSAIFCAGGIFMGHSTQSINDNSMRAVGRSSDLLGRLIPRTLQQWGAYSVVAAFLLLGLGALISFTRREAVVDKSNGDEGGG
jgi:hypothetical protein